MEVLGHAAVALNSNTVHLTVLLKKLQEYDVILMVVKDLFPAVTSLGYVMRTPGYNDSRDSRHGYTIQQSFV